MTAILIPVYHPENSFVSFVKDLNDRMRGSVHNGQYAIVIVNDGNPVSSECFKKLQVENNIELIHHAVNQGKGRALKTGLNHILLNHPDCTECITCDADGQHDINDILNILSSEHKENALTLGVRQFADASIPFRSRLGNSMTRILFILLTGLKIQDTQTGLRMFSGNFIRTCMGIEGERYEYETNMLLNCKTNNIPITQIPIRTIYLNGNSTSHFNPLLDSIKIYKMLFKFMFSSFSASILDFTVFSALYFATSKLLLSMIISRIMSVCFNFFANKHFVFNKHAKETKYFIRYGLLALTLFCAAYVGIQFISSHLPIPVYISKMIVETVLFLASYTIQRDFIFK